MHSEQGTGPALTVAIILIILEAPYSQARAWRITVSPGSPPAPVIGHSQAIISRGNGRVRGALWGSSLLSPSVSSPCDCLSAAELESDRGIGSMNM